MPLQRERDVVQISIEVKYIKGGTTGNDPSNDREAKCIRDAFGKVSKALEELLSAVVNAKGKGKYVSDLQRIESRLKAMISGIKKVEDLKQVTGRVEEAEKFFNEIKQGEKVVVSCQSESETSCCCFKSSKSFTEDLQDLDNSLEKFNQKIVRAPKQEEIRTSDAPVGARQQGGAAEFGLPGKTKNTGGNDVVQVKEKKVENGKVTQYPQTEKTKEEKVSFCQDDSSPGMITSSHAPPKSWDSQFPRQLEAKTHQPNPKPASGSLRPDVFPGEKNGLVSSKPPYSDLTVPYKPPEMNDRQPKIDRSIQEEKNCPNFSNTASSSMIVTPKTSNKTTSSDASRDLKKEMFKDGLNAVYSAVPREYGDLGNELPQHEKLQGGKHHNANWVGPHQNYDYNSR